ncbi:flagellar basal-body rod protein FlgF [Aduncisulcus paluster]|uniref:Flagellar basal-body rod protein FlgF n=1 Tax=Aduncisulcus paluster TaxID=2918883 RepID=A0ABQ5KMS5_9EUKA|nr:flagellar basal-body rod protein FlgF [Aduncisulcus paluster]
MVTDGGEPPMQNTLLVGLSKQMVLERQMDVVSNNIANMNTNGYKADRSLFQEYLSSNAHEDNFASADRRGNLAINNRGQLVTASGYQVLGTAGPITFQQTDHDVSIAADGNITVLEGTSRLDSIRGKLRLVSFAQAQRLLKEGGNLYAPGEGAVAQPATKAQVRQGFIEKSNVNSVVEMSRMIEITRTYTQIASLLQQQSDLHKSAIEKLADVPN